MVTWPCWPGIKQLIKTKLKLFTTSWNAHLALRVMEGKLMWAPTRNAVNTWYSTQLKKITNLLLIPTLLCFLPKSYTWMGINQWWLGSKRHWTFGNCQRPVFSLGVFQHMQKMTSLWKCWLNWSLKLQNNNKTKRKTPCRHNSVSSDRNTGIWPEVFYYFSEKLPLSQKIMLLQRESFLTMFYTINSSPLLNTKYGFMQIYILSNYQ